MSGHDHRYINLAFYSLRPLDVRVTSAGFVTPVDQPVPTTEVPPTCSLHLRQSVTIRIQIRARPQSSLEFRFEQIEVRLPPSTY